MDTAVGTHNHHRIGVPAREESRGPEPTRAPNSRVHTRCKSGGRNPTMAHADEIQQKVAKLPIVEIPVSQIKSDNENPNQMGEELFEGLVQHIKENGIINPIIITEEMLLADGEHRLKAAKRLGMQTIPARIIPNDERLRRLLRQTMNKLKGTHDVALDAEEYKKLIELDGIVPLANYLGEDCGDLLKVLDDVILPQKNDPDDYDLDSAVEEIETPITKPGDVIKMGDHILICGDCTDPAVWAKIADGDRFSMMMTDPPYNCAIEGVGKNHKKITIKNDNISDTEFEALLSGFMRMVMEYVVGAQYIFMSSEQWPRIHRIFVESGGHWSTTIIWVKSHFCMSRRDFHPKYEPILYGWNSAGSRHPVASRRETDVWNVDKINRHESHPTMKPVTLYRKAILLSSKPLDTVVDPFGGSGSCVIACEQTHRRCRTIELDPVYCDVIVKRWEEFTGRKAERITE